MATVTLTLKGEQREFESGITPAEIAKSIGMGLYKAACAARVDGQNVDLRTPITHDCEVEILTFDDEYGKKAFWHSSSHLMAQAIHRLFPDVKFAIGPAIDSGFYYDLDSERTFTPDDFEAIEAEMAKIVKANIPLERFTLDRNEALEFMKAEPYKVELISELPEGETISFYKQDDFCDLCAGPHLMSTGAIAAVKLTSITGAYWRGDASNKMLQRLYGIAFPKSAQLKEHLLMLEEAKKRDHRKLGKELELFEIMEEGPGFPFFFPKGMVIRNKLEEMWREEHRKAGYVEIKTPLILNRSLWERSGHWGHYRENMYTTLIDETDFAIKPMNCPGGILVYNNKLMSYRDLPYRVGELGIVHRHELSGALHGLMRVRCFTQDDAHLYITEDQIVEEILGIARLDDKLYRMFGFEYSIELSTRPDDFMGEKETWDKAEASLKEALDRFGKPYKINPGDGAFYGPKIDFHLRDCVGRTWQCGTIQLDYQLPERFDMTYIGADGEKHRPVMLHRTILGSIERFIGILTEHFAGAFPLWMAPVQVMVIPIAEAHHEYASQVANRLNELGMRVECDKRSEKMGYKIREAQLQKIPYMLVVGDKEKEAGAVAIRSRKNGDMGTKTLDEFIKLAQQEIDEKSF